MDYEKQGIGEEGRGRIRAPYKLYTPRTTHVASDSDACFRGRSGGGSSGVQSGGVSRVKDIRVMEEYCLAQPITMTGGPWGSGKRASQLAPPPLQQTPPPPTSKLSLLPPATTTPSHQPPQPPPTTTLSHQPPRPPPLANSPTTHSS
ncbi:hypothetical protein Pcinc_042227 [Petrolisthes cinctipes]|uniref:Uncharacterized protein n=1 Tax=Petrolisthes cinctipes TaxID=88211 RepID=A0AAE1EH66_PETCI|nr:hypothetical protein Pcinc_042227 [Petrolisthes cinctipes]